MHINHSTPYDLYNQAPPGTGPKATGAEQTSQTRAQRAYDQHAGAAAVLEAEYVDNASPSTHTAVSLEQQTGQRLAAELYYLNSDENQQVQSQASLSTPTNSQTQVYLKLSGTETSPHRGTYLNIVA